MGILLSLPAALPACTPSPQEAVIDHTSPTPVPAPSATAAAPAGRSISSDAVTSVEKGIVPGQAAQGPMLEPVSAAGNPAPTPPDAAQGRRILSTAFVRVGPDGHLTIDLRDGRSVVLRDVVMGPQKYCGMLAHSDRYCGRYADVLAARPGGVTASTPADTGTGNPLPMRE